tara:strand:- start:1324 stop:1539 length:216 start_codon:yes stop_codon:yes gene_type:complete
MQVGDLIKIKKGCFMGGKMGLIVKLGQDAKGNPRYWINLIGSVPTAIKGKAIMYRAERFTLIKSSIDRDHK